MSTSKKYVATIQILMDASSSDEACDGLSAILSDGCAPDFGFVLEWRYLMIGDQFMYPTQRYVDEMGEQDV